MKNVCLFVILAAISGQAYSGDPLEICLLTGKPSADVQYESIRKIKVGKNSYGSVSDILPRFADSASSLGANAVVNYIGSQRFGFWPWRIVRPIVRGEAVKLNLGRDQTCESIGGATVRRVIETNTEPHLIEKA